MKKATKYWFAGILILFVALNGCDTNRVYDENFKLPKEGWRINKTIKFTPEIKDTSSAHHVFINVRNDGDYEWSNLYLFIKTTAPNGASVKDTVNLILADEKGKWLGNGFGSIWDHQVYFKKNILFPANGNYVFEIQHGMRTANLENILDIGIRIEKVKIN